AASGMLPRKCPVYRRHLPTPVLARDERLPPTDQSGPFRRRSGKLRPHGRPGQRAGRSFHRSRSTHHRDEEQSPGHSYEPALVPQIENDEAVVLQETGETCTQVAMQPCIMVKPPKSRPGENDEFRPCFP